MNDKDMKSKILNYREKRAENNLAMVEMQIELNERKATLNEMVSNRYKELKRDYSQKVDNLKVSSVQEVGNLAKRYGVDLGDGIENIKIKLRHSFLDNIEKDVLKFKNEKEKELGINSLNKKIEDRMQVSSNFTGKILDLNKNDLQR